MSVIDGVGSDTRKAAVGKYFKQTPSDDEANAMLRLFQLSIVAAVGAVALLLVGSLTLALVAGAAAAVLLMQGLAARARYRRRHAAAEPKPTDAQVDALLRDDLRLAGDRALHRLGLTWSDLELHSGDVGQFASDGTRRLAGRRQDPVWVFGPATESRARIGADRKWRFTRCSIMVICPTAHHLGIYECELDLASGARSVEETHEYHYADLVGVRTTTTSVPEVSVDVLDHTGQYRWFLDRGYHRDFQIVASSGDRSSIIIGLRREDDRDDSVLLRESGYEQVIEAVRRVLRRKKGGRPGGVTCPIGQPWPWIVIGADETPRACPP
jgi:hypothetical protein